MNASDIVGATTIARVLEALGGDSPKTEFAWRGASGNVRPPAQRLVGVAS